MVTSLLAVVFVVSVRRGRHDLVDVAWGLGFALIAITTFVLSTGDGDLATRAVITALTVAWGLRLTVHIGLRNRGKPEDRRYVEIRSRARGNPNRHLLEVVYLTQGAVMLLVSLPVQAGQYGPGTPAWLLWLGAVVWLVGFVFETVGDWQLRRFTAQPANHGRVLDRGLWRYTRHPNYFGDATVWWGLYLLGCGTWPGAATMPAPIAMTLLLTKGTGKPLTEKHLANSHPEYADYLRRTSGFLPCLRTRPNETRDDQPPIAAPSPGARSGRRRSSGQSSRARRLPPRVPPPPAPTMTGSAAGTRPPGRPVRRAGGRRARPSGGSSPLAAGRRDRVAPGFRWRPRTTPGRR